MTNSCSVTKFNRYLHYRLMRKVLKTRRKCRHLVVHCLISVMQSIKYSPLGQSIWISRSISCLHLKPLQVNHCQSTNFCNDKTALRAIQPFVLCYLRMWAKWEKRILKNSLKRSICWSVDITLGGSSPRRSRRSRSVMENAVP